MSSWPRGTEEYPFYRLFHESKTWRIDLVLASVDTEHPSYDPDDSWTHHVKCRSIAEVNTREAAEAVLRLTGADAYQDWTSGKGWASPMVPCVPITDNYGSDGSGGW